MHRTTKPQCERQEKRVTLPKAKQNKTINLPVDNVNACSRRSDQKDQTRITKATNNEQQATQRATGTSKNAN
jgi:hypothetical protein